MNEEIYTVELYCGNEKPVTMYESKIITAAKLVFKSLVNSSGNKCNLPIHELSGLWERVYRIKLVAIKQDDDGCISDVKTISASDYYWMD